MVGGKIRRLFVLVILVFIAFLSILGVEGYQPQFDGYFINMNTLQTADNVFLYNLLSECEKGWLDEGTCLIIAASLECGTTPRDACAVTQDTTFVQGTYDLPNGIYLDANNIILNCNGATLQGTSIYSGSGINSHVGKYSDYATIKNCVITNYSTAIWIRGDHNTLSSNTLDNNLIGIGISSDSDYNLISSNDISNSYTYGILLSGSNNQINSNTIRGNFVGMSLGGYNNQISSNTFCPSSSTYDIQLDQGTNTGDNNRCDKPGSWNDYEAAGCTYSCSAQQCTSGPCCNIATGNYYTPSDSHDCSFADSCLSDDLCTHYECDGTGADSSACTIKAGCFDCGNKDCDVNNHYFKDVADSAEGTNNCYYRDYVDCNRPCSSNSCQDCSCDSSSDIWEVTAGICKYISGCSGSTSGTVENYAQGESCGTNKECDGGGNCVDITGDCNNGVKDGDEIGIDCGGSCPNQDCCSNGYEDGNLGEGGVDCGESCHYSCVIPVILVHGYYSSPDGAWTTMKTWLENDGFTVYTLDLRNGMPANGDIREYARRLSNRIKTVKQATRAKEVDLVVHSMGGLVGRWYINEFWGGYVRKIIMLGTPNHGSELFYERYLRKLASFFVDMGMLNEAIDFLEGEAAKQMTPYSSFLNQLNNGDPWDFGRKDITAPGISHYTFSGTGGFCLWGVCPTSYILFGEDDGVVRVESSRLEGVPNYKYGVNHINLHEDNSIYGLVKDFLSGNSSSMSFVLPSSESIEESIAQYQEGQFIEGTINNAQEKVHVVPVDAVNSVIFDLVWVEGKINFNLVTPGGVLIDPDFAESNSSVDYYNGSYEKSYKIQDPEAGDWELHLYGLDLTTEYSIFTFFETDITLNISLSKYQYKIDEQINLTAELKECPNQLTEAIVTAKIKKPDDSIEFLVLYDDGANNDLIAGDGIYNNFYTGTGIYGRYDITITANGIIDSEDFSREAFVSVWVEDYPDLTVKDISFSNSVPTAGDNITINALIENIGEKEALDATIEFYHSTRYEDELIGEDNISVGIGGEIVASVDWTNLSAGNYNVTVLVSPFNSFLERNYSNNRLKKEIYVYDELVILNDYTNLNLIFNSSGNKIVYLRIPMNKVISKAQFDVELKNTFQWQKTFGGTDDDGAYSVQQTTDGGYILVGTSDPYTVDVYLIKTDSNGNEEWSKTFGGSDWVIARSVQQTTDGGYIIAGVTWSAHLVNWGFYLIKTDSNGNEEWSETFGGSDGEGAYSVQQTTDGGYILAGWTSSFGAGNDDVYLIKTDSSGDEQWDKTFGGSDGEGAYSVQQTFDGGYIIAGYTNSFGAGNDDVYLIKTDSNGNEEWSRTFGGLDYDYARSIQQTTDGGYIVVGHSSSFGAGGSDVYLIKTDSNGNEEWSETFGGSDGEGAYSVQQTFDGGYIIAGYTNSFGFGNDDVYLIKTDSNGNEEWSETFGGTSRDRANSVQQTTDGGYITVGHTKSFGSGGYDVYIIQLSPETYLNNLVINILNDDTIEYNMPKSQKITINLSDLSDTYPKQEHGVLVPILISSNSGGLVEITNITIEFLGQEYNISLDEGWNLVSLPLIPDNKKVSNIFTDYSKIFAYDGTWHELDNNSEINETKGYWIKSLNNQTLTIEGDEFTYPIDIALTEGWNLIPYPSLNTTLINESLDITYDSVLTYKDKKWWSYSPFRPDNMNTLRYFIPGYGYWVKVPSNITWEFYD